MTETAQKTKPQAYYPSAQANPDFAKIEQNILAQWKEDGTFQKSVDQRPASNEYTFYDGPPFANGLPHYGHLLTGFVKDLYARYHTMKGERVERRFGWDCHGLPAEMGAEKELNISGRKAIEDFGIDKFNAHCRSSVMKYAGDWETYVDRQARWVDFEGDYKTMDKNFMESVIWAFKQLYDKGLIYQSHRVMPYSWAAETPLSNFETKLDNSYRTKVDKAVTVKFRLKTPPKGAPEAENYYLLAWTTTPWTLPSNLALAVDKELGYEMVVVPSLRGAEGEEAIQSGLPRSSAASARNDVWIFAAFYEKEAEKTLGKEINPATWNEEKNEENLFSVSLMGDELIGLEYEPLFPYFADHPNAFRVLDGSSFIEEGSGTGIVHMAPGFGEDDQRVCAENGIEVVVPVDEQGKYTDEIFDLPCHSERSEESKDPSALPQDDNYPPLSLRGLNVIAQTEGKQDDEPYSDKQLEKYGLVNLRIIDWLKKSGNYVTSDDYSHNYPHCWRTDTPLIYRAMPSWYVEVTKFRDRAVELNKQINWIPSHIRDGQMAHMLATAPDWSISRNRFWGTPIPIWEKQDGSGELKAFGSIAELEEFFVNPHSAQAQRDAESQAAGGDAASSAACETGWLADLHRPMIDQLTTAKDGSQWQRTSDVFDCWFESGSMPFAQVHYPFENKEWFDTHFPADFITEYVGQTRGWFNTLIILATALFDKPPFKNCICHGVVLDSETGLKYSKRLKNYKNPLEVIDQYGADALRWLMMDSPVMRGHDLSVDPEGKFIRDVVRLHIKPIWNAYNFFTLYANADGVKAELLSNRHSCESRNPEKRDPSVRWDDDLTLMDRYILAKCREAVEQIESGLDAYDTPSACAAVSSFFEVLNNWYIRRNKERFWNESSDSVDQAAFDTLYSVLVTMCKAAAPLLPLTLEEIYRGLTGGDSVHLQDFPSLRGADSDEAIQSGSPRFARDDELIANMDRVRDACNAALSVRSKENIRVRQPLTSITIYGTGSMEIFKSKKFDEIIMDEVNVKVILFDDELENAASHVLKLNNQILGKRLPEKMKQIIPAAKKGEWELVENRHPRESGDLEIPASAGMTVKICDELLLPEEYDLQLTPKEGVTGAAALSTNDALVVLDLEITPSLAAEGTARDFVRMVQEARKNAGLHVSNRIALSVQAGGKVTEAIEANKPYITEQVLASSLELGEVSATHRFEQELEGEKITFGFEVV